ncbi:hypothetical protein D9619_003229 [Psilocybe cf. subviscida]|uniref:Uncharacterized protein n=1 Tax=Psilocybe cf. subviscida TaxID=2480587 RepID=A0A8H5AVM7_9AGAR|nr:hypothetical protein D9619_003229 [Psilocybe cf. subviscida]
MIAGLSKAVSLYLAPALCLTAVILTLLSLLAPSLILHDQVAFLTVVPSTALQGPSSANVDGPTIYLGVIGSCARKNNAAEFNCTVPSVSPAYDVSILPNSAPGQLLSVPPGSAVFIAFSVACMIIFFVTFTLISFSHKMGGKASSMFNSSVLQRISAWIGFFGFLVGLTVFLIVRMWFGKAIQDFNASIIQQGKNGPSLQASSGNAFTMVWVAYAFYAIPIVSSLAKLNVTPNSGKDGDA